MSKKLALIDKQQVDNLAGWLNFAIMRLRLKGATQRKIRVPVLPTFRPNSRQLNDFQLLLELEDRLIVAKDAFLKLNEVSLSPAKLLELIERETKDWNPNQQLGFQSFVSRSINSSSCLLYTSPSPRDS